MSKKRIATLIFLFFVPLLLLFYQPISSFVLNKVLSSILHTSLTAKVSCGKWKWSQGAIVLTEMEIHDKNLDIKIGEIHYRPHFLVKECKIISSLSTQNLTIDISSNQQGNENTIDLFKALHGFKKLANFQISQGIVLVDSQENLKINLLQVHNKQPELKVKVDFEIHEIEHLLKKIDSSFLQSYHLAVNGICGQLDFQIDYFGNLKSLEGVVNGKNCIFQKDHEKAKGSFEEIVLKTSYQDTQEFKINLEKGFSLGHLNGLNAELCLEKGCFYTKNESNEIIWEANNLFFSSKFTPNSIPEINLSGMIVKENRAFPFSFEGAGEFHHFDDWKLDLHNNASIDIEFKRIKEIAIHKSGPLEFLIKTTVDGLDELDVSMIQELLFPVSTISACLLEKGKISADISLSIEKDRLNHVVIENLCIEKTSLSIQKLDLKVSLDKLYGRIVIPEPLNFSIDKISADLQIDHCQINHHKIDNELIFSGTLYYLDPKSILISLFLSYQETFFSLESSGSLEKIDLKIQTTFKDGSFISPIQKRVKEKFPNLNQLQRIYLESQISLKNKEFHTLGTASLIFDNYQDTISFSSIFDQNKIFNNPLLSFVKGEFSSPNISQDSYLLFLEPYQLKWHVLGDMRIKGEITKESLLFDLYAKSAVYDSEDIVIEILENGIDHHGRFHFDLEKKFWEIDLPLEKARCKDKKFRFPFEEVKTHIRIEGNHLYAKSVKGNCEKINFEGDIHVDFKDPSWIHLEIFPSLMKGSTQNLLTFLNYIPELKFNQDFLNVDGNFFGYAGNYLSIFYNETSSQKEGKIDLHIDKTSCKIENILSFKEIEFDLFFDFGKGALEIKEFNGYLIDQEKPYRIQIQEAFCLDLAEFLWNFDVRLQNEMMDIFRLCLHSKKQKDGIEVIFHPLYNQIFGSRVFVKSFLLDSSFLVTKLDLDIEVKNGDIEKISDLSFFPLNQSLKSIALEGDLSFHVFYDKKEALAQISARSDQISFAGCMQKPLNFSLTKKQDTISLDRGDYGDWRFDFSGRVHPENNTSLIIDRFAGRHLSNYFCSSSGVLNKDKCEINIEEYSFNLVEIKDSFAPFFHNQSLLKGKLQGSSFFKIELSDLPQGLKISGKFDIGGNSLTCSNFHLKSTPSISFYYSPTHGCKFDEVSLFFTAENQQDLFLSIRCKDFQILSKGSFEINEVSCSISPEMISYLFKSNLIDESMFYNRVELLSNYKISWENQIDTEFNLSYHQGAFQIQGSIKEGYYWIGKESVYINKCYYFLDQHHINIFSAIDYKKVSFDLLTKIALKDELEIGIEIKEGHATDSEDDRSCLEILFKSDKEGLMVQSLQGEMFGLDFSFRKNPRAYSPSEIMLTGQLKIDAATVFESFSHYLPEKIKDLKLGKGYELSGDFHISKSDLRSSYFRGFLKGRDFDLFGCYFKTLLSEVEIKLSQIQLKDVSLSDQSGVMKMKEIKLYFDDQWRMRIPDIHVQDFRPSLLKKSDQPEEKIKPFVIKELHITNFEGNLGDKNSFKGKGYLDFLNTFKTEKNILDIPIEILGRIGFDLGIFIPVIGKLNFEIGAGKILLKEFKNTFSEGKRSRFYLSGYKDSYIGLDGQLFIDIKMKQYVLLKITEPFTVSVRGSLTSPKYSLR